MIKYNRFVLENGLRVLVHTDKTTPIAAINVLYDVGSRDEDQERTGFAHLFEHLMFGGSANIPKYDEPLEIAGGENNAFTNSDITNYYLTLPVQNLETGFWLESDRMLSLAFTEKSLDVQRNVVSEEFRQVYLNQPYGDTWLLLRDLAYKVHPYQWPTIGKDISHIQNAKMKDVKDFFRRFYCPNNAILVVAGNVTPEQVRELAEKWFGKIPRGPENRRDIPQEPLQTEARALTVYRQVPQNAIYKAYHCCSRFDKEYYTVDLLSDALSLGNSSRLYQSLVKERNLFSEINAYITVELDNGLFIISGRVSEGISVEEADNAIAAEIDKVKGEFLSISEMVKLKNKVESRIAFSNTSVLNKAMNLAFAELMGKPNLVNKEFGKYKVVNRVDIREQANIIFRDGNCSTLYYLVEQPEMQRQKTKERMRK
ncbi:MAG: insulinase family protein [Bacteroidetes bacterium]|nr:insulinase family protein [Bacteroidota bacterium]